MIRKKNLLLLCSSLLLVLSLLLLPVMAGCGEAATEVEAEVEAEVEIDEETGLKVVKVVRQDNFGAVETTVMQLDKWEEIWEKVANKYGYTFEWTHYWNSALYSAEAACEAVGMGALTTVGPTHYMLMPMEPRLAVYGLAFLFINGPHVQAFMDQSPVVQDIQQGLMNKQNVIMPFPHATFRMPDEARGETPASYAFYLEKPVWEMEDLEGMRIRTMTDPGQIRMGLALGFNAQAIAFSEAGMALQTGMLDGLVTCPNYKAYMVPIGVLEHLDYCMWWPPTQVGSSGNIFNYEWWSQFPEEMQEELRQGLVELFDYRLRNITYISSYETGEVIKNEMGCTRLTIEEFERWQEACREPIWNWWSKDVEGGAEIVASVEAATPPLEPHLAKIDAYLGDSLIWPD